MIDGRLSLTTPEGVRLLLTPAGPVPRAWAWALDFFIWFFAMFLCAMLLNWSKTGYGLYLIVLFVSYWGYPVVCEVYFGGRTPGKRALGLEVLRADGLPVGWRESSLRNLLLVADFLPFLYMSGLLCMLSNAQFRRIGDIVAGTQVVYREKAQARRATPQVAATALPFPLTPHEQRTLIDLFERESNLPPERVLELASIAEPLTGATDVQSLQRLRAFVAGLVQ